jgi:hypothetical protein
MQPIMWSSARDRKEHNLTFDMAASALYIQQQIVLNRSEILFRAVEGGLVPLEDILAFPINWVEMATNHMTRQKMIQISQAYSAGMVTNYNSSLGLYNFDESSKSSSSRVSISPELPRMSPEIPKQSPTKQNKEYKAPPSKPSFSGDEEMDAMLSNAVKETMKDSAGLPIIQDRDETFFYSSLSSTTSSLSDSASSPPTSIPPTPTFSIRELSSEPESFPSSPASTQQYLIKEDSSTFIPTSLAKRRKVMDNLRLPSLSTPNPTSWWPVSIPAQ